MLLEKLMISSIRLKIIGERTWLAADWKVRKMIWMAFDGRNVDFSKDY
jgi:hypothetical protein